MTNSGFDLGKFGTKDPEELAQARLVKTVSAPLEFDSLVASVMQARANGPVYDSVWVVLETLVMEVNKQKTQIAALTKQLEQQKT